MYDFAIDINTGDWVFSGNRDIQGVQGNQVVAQRIHTRLSIVRGTWHLDPTNGSLGSRLETLFRIPRQRALLEARLMVEEAVASMDDVNLTNVTIEEEGLGGLRLKIDYEVTQSDDFLPASDRLNESLTIDLPVVRG